jgi:hypothetical protein
LWIILYIIKTYGKSTAFPGFQFSMIAHIKGGKSPAWALLRREYRQIQPEATSVAVRVRIYRPEVACPQW